MKNRSESEILNSICEYLKVKKYFFWRNNNIAVFDSKRKCFRKFPKWCVKGVPDIFVLTPTRTIGLECKRKGTYQTPNQRVFQTCWDSNTANREYHVVRNVDDVVNLGL